jgi:hypothetical protein
MDNEEKIKVMEEKISNLETELQATKEHLKKYTAPAYKKEYYEKNKDIINERNNNYKQNYTPTPEQKKTWARTAYLKKKEKLQQEMEEKPNGVNI